MTIGHQDPDETLPPPPESRDTIPVVYSLHSDIPEGPPSSRSILANCISLLNELRASMSEEQVSKLDRLENQASFLCE